MSSHTQRPQCVVRIVENAERHVSLMMSNGIEAILSDSKKKYNEKVNALLAAWEYVTNYLANCIASTHESPSLIEWVNKYTLELVLRGEWPKLAPATKTHLSVTLQKCATQLAQQQNPAARRCQALIELVKDPWGKPALDKILNGQLGTEHEEEEFCCQEKGELLEMRLKTLCEDRCEDIAVNLAAACVRSLRRNDRLRSLSDSGQVHYMIDVYIVLLYKLKRTHDIVAQLKLMDLTDGLELMQRLSGEKPTKYGTARVWRNSSKAAELVAQYLVTTGMVRPLVDVSAATLEHILNSWALLHAKSKDAVATLPGIIRKLIEPAESAQHIYIFGGVLVRHYGDALKPLVIELYIRALTTDMNELENQKSKSNKEKMQETAKRLSQEFLKLADYVNDSVGIARECVLTAFSLHPTRACYDRIRELAVACGKIKPDDAVKVKPEASGDEEQQRQEEGEPKNAVAVVDGEKEAAADNVKQETVADDITDENSKCHSPEKPKVLTSDGDQDKPPSNGADKKTEPEDKKDNTQESQTAENGQLEALILIKGHAVTGSANYDEKAVPEQVLDGEKLGISPQLCDDLAVVLSSQRYHVLTWWLDWKELSDLCERYLENAQEMRNTNKELKYLNIDYSQFKDHPYEDDPRDSPFYGIEKGYEQWDDSDYSESDTYQQSLKTTARRSLDESSDTDSENLVKQPAKRGRPRKVPRLESSESEYDRKPRPRFRKALMISSSESDTNTQDSRASSLGSDGFRGKETKRSTKAKRPAVPATTTTCNGAKKPVVRRRGPAKKKLTVASVSHFHMLVNENERPCTGDDNSNNDIMTLFSADMDEKRETIKGTAAFNTAQLIITEKRSDPEVIKSLRMFRPHGKKLSQINNEKSIPSPSVTATTSPGKKKENNNIVAENGTNGLPTKFAPMLSTLNLNPKIALRRVDEMDKKIVAQQKKQAVSPGDLSNELKNIQKTIPFANNKNSLTNFQKQKKLSKPRKSMSPKTMKSELAKSKLQEILTKSVPGMGSMEFSVPPRVQSTVHVVQLTRNIPQSPNSTASGNTPPRSRSNIQLPGTPSSGGHDSGVGMSPAGQTPPPPTRSSSLQDVAEEANQPPDTSPGLDSTNASTMDSTDGTRTVALAVLANQRIGSGQSPKKSPSPSTNSTADQHQQQQPPQQQQQQQQLFLCKPDGTYHLVSPSVVTGQRSILSVQNFEDGNIGFARQVPVASVAGTEAKTSQAQTGRNAGLPKFQQAFGKTICTLSTENTTLPSSSAETHEAPAAPAGAATNVRGSAKAANSPNISKSVQTSVQSASIASLPNLQVSPGARQILNLVQSAVTSASAANAAVTAGSGGQALQLCSVPNSTPGVIYTHKLAGANPTTQLISIPAGISNNRSNVVSLGVVKSGQLKVNIIRPVRTSTGTIQVVASRIQQQQPQQQPQQQQHQQQQPQQQQPQQSQQPQQQQQQQQTVRTADPLMNSTMEMSTNQSQPTLSSSTLEQLREFESVLEQVKERSTSQSSATDTTTVQTQTQTTAPVKQPQSQQVNVSSLTQQLLMSSQSPSSALEFPSNGNTVTFQQQEVYPQKVALMYTNQNSSTATSKVVNSTPVVVVTSYCQPAASPALSVTSQSSSSPCVTPAPTPVSSTGKTQPQSTLKNTKKAAPKAVKQVSAQSAAKAAPIPKPQQKPQEDPETTQRIYAILGQYAEQLRNSPDLNNKPAPRRRSNPPTNPNQSSKRKKSGSGKSKTPSGQQTSEPSPSADDAGRTMGSSEDSSGGGGGAGSGTSNTAATLMHVQDSPAGYSASEETLPSSNNNSQGAVNDNATLGNVSETRTASTTSDSNDGVESNVKRRNLIFTEPNTGQARAVIVQEALQPTSVGEALASVTGKMATGTAVLVSGTNFMLPMNFVKSGQQITVVSGGSKLLAAVPTVRASSGASGVSNAFVLQSLLSQANKVIQQQQQQQQQQQGQSKQVKLAQQVVIPQTGGGVVRFASEDSTDVKVDTKVETSKVPTTAIGLFQHSGVITSNPNIGQRLFNSSAVKFPVKNEGGQQQVVCLTAPGVVKETDGHKLATSGIALAFAANNDISNANVMQALKDVKDEPLNGEDDDRIVSPKAVKRKEEHTLVDLGDAVAQCNVRVDSTQQLNHSVKQESPVPSLTPRTTSTSSSSLDTATTQFLVSGGPSSSDSQESVTSTIQSSAMESSMDGVKVENGVLCGNARLQEAWEPERKGSPDTPWRYQTTTSLGMDQLKVYSRDGESSETVHNSVLHIINKGQGIELSSGGVFQTKKYYHTMNNSIDAFHKYPAKGLTNKSSQPNNARTTAEQESQQRLNERKQQLIERELTLQKSLSEECEDLGVEEPSANDLFPEADLLFDTNHSPSFDHSSQEASCSQTLSGTTGMSGLKYGGSSVGSGSFFKLDSVTSVSRDESLVTTLQAIEPKKKAPQQRRPAKPKETQARRNKRTSDGLLAADSGNVSEPKQLRLHLVDHLSQDDASNSNSDLSRLSSTTENEALKESSNQKAVNRNGSKDREGTPSSSRSSMHSQVKLELDAGSPATIVSTQSEIVRRVIDVNNISSITSSGEDDESLTLLDDSTANVAMPSPLSPIGGSLLTARYTYTNNKKKTPTTMSIKQPRAADFFRTTSLSWESPISERTRSSSDEEEDNDEENEGDESSMGEVFGTSQLEDGDVSAMGNGLLEVIRNVPSVKVTPVDHATYSAKKKPSGVRRTAVNHKDSATGVSPSMLNKSAEVKTSGAMNVIAATKKLKTATGSLAVSSTSENETPSPAALSDKLFEVIPSDDEARASTPTASTGPGADHCSSTARRSSLRGHVKKNCPCCNGSSPEPRKPKKAAPPKPQAQADSSGKIKRPSKQQQQQQQQQQQHQQQHQQQTKQPGKKR